MRNVAHPVDVACLFMEKTPRVMLVGEGAKPFANEQGVPEVPIEKLVTEFAKACLERTQKKGVSGTKEFGYVAEDRHFNTSSCDIQK
jgi:isoaspartyl peptidase/L-asparaginase-like protein (Ntn-hydrolase superfamily)